jgi:flagellar basal body P-ring protein FlgI
VRQEILNGTLVQGSVEGADNSILAVNQEVEPPGYEAPRDDFEIKATKGK